MIILDQVPLTAPVKTVILMAGANDVEKGNIAEMIDDMRSIIAIITHRFPEFKLEALKYTLYIETILFAISFGKNSNNISLISLMVGTRFQ